MSTDQEPVPSEENNTHPPFLTDNQLQQLGHSFSYDDFNIVTPTTGESYLVITVPESGQSLVDRAFTKAKETAFSQVKEVGTGLANSDLSEEAQAEEREAWSELYLPTLKGVDSIYFILTLSSILLSAELGAQLNALRSISDMTDPQERVLAERELIKKQAVIDKFVTLEKGRFMFYNGNNLVYKTPTDLENPYSPSHVGRQN